MFEPRSFRYELDADAGVATLTLDRPERLNALTFEAYDELRRIFPALSAEKAVRVVVITGSGRAFCSGGDVEDIIGALFARDFRGLLEFTRMTCDVVREIRACRKPVIGALNGTVAGAGAVIATACDLRVAAESAKIAYLFTRVGLSGADMGAAWMLPRIVGLAKASELLMTGDFISAQEAHRIGLYNRVVPDGEALPAALELARKLSKGPSFAIEITKDALGREAAMDLPSALEAEAQIQAALMMHPDFRESYDAFVAKREAEVPVRAVDTAGVRALLDERHATWAAEVSAFARSALAPRPEPEGDAAGRVEARALLAAMGAARVFAPIGARDLRGCCLAREAVAAASPLADAVWALQGLGITPLLLAGSEEQKERWVARGLAGDAMGAFAITEPEAGSDVASLTTRATRDGDAWVLDGRKCLISNAGIADWYVTFASTDPERGSRGITAFLVPADAPGLAFAGAQVMSAAHPLGELVFEGCRVPASAVIGEVGAGFKLGMATLDQLRPTVGAAACGMARRALDEALDHALGRVQFGKPLSDFQIVQEKLGRMAIELDAARLLVYRAAWEKDHGAERITLEAAMAKAYATEAAQRVIDQAVQILGGKGVLASSVVDRLYRSVRALRIYEGTTEIQHLIVAGRILADAKETQEARA